MIERIYKKIREQKQFLEKKTGLFTRVGHHDRTVDLAKKYQEALVIAVDCIESAWMGNTQGVRKRLCMDALRRIDDKIQIKTNRFEPEEKE